jgi:uncharacterized protein YecE (DUF72 family)
MRLWVGTSGFSYDEWTGPFYPPDLPAQDRLAFYAQRLPAVEINNTFYRMPAASLLEGWAARVSPEFRFAIKAPRRITHIKRLKDAAEDTAYLLRAVAALGPRLGCLLFQLPPNLRADLDRLDAFLALLPEGTRAAFEFRHPSWREAGVGERLVARGLAWVEADTDDAPAAAPATGPGWGYLRLRRTHYEPADLAAWFTRLEAASWAEAFVFFKHEDAAAGPRLAAEFLAQNRSGPPPRGGGPPRKSGRRRPAGS